MTIMIGKYEFEGPFKKVSELDEKPGLFAVLHCDDEEYTLIKLSQTTDIRSLIELSPSSSNLDAEDTTLAVFYTQDCGLRQRQEMVEEILIEFGDEQEQFTEEREHLVKNAS